MLKSDLIFMDTAHTGEYEYKIYNFLKSNNYQGLLLLDDIFLNQNMLYFWGEIEKPKYDLTKYGHASGTGLVIFNPDIQVILE